MRTIDRVHRILGKSSDFDEIEPLIELKPDAEKFATVEIRDSHV
jgi:hypothetical protein